MKSRILVIDDNVNLTTLLSKTLGRFGYDVAVENDSTFAVDTTRRVRPQLILLDVMMPNRDGGEVLGELRQDSQLRRIPVILLTALAKEAHGLADQGGIRSTVISKPVELRTLMMEIEKHLDHSNSFTPDEQSSAFETSAPQTNTQAHAMPAQAQAPTNNPPMRAGGAFGGLPPEGIPDMHAPAAFGGSQPAAEPAAPRQPVPTQFRALMGQLPQQQEGEGVEIPR